MHLATPDTKLLIGSGLGFLGVAVVGQALVGAWVYAVLLPVAVVLCVGVVLDVHRSLLRSGEQQRTQVQALLGIHQVLSLRAPLPPMSGWACTPELAALVVGQILERKPRQVVEIGSGASTVVTAYALERNGQGRVISLDHDPLYAAQTRANLAQHGHGDRATVLDAPLVPHRIGDEQWQWYDLRELVLDGPIDLLVLDGPALATQPLARYPALPLLLPHLADDAVVILDDAARSSERAVVERWLRENPGAFEHAYHPALKGISVLRRRPA